MKNEKKIYKLMALMLILLSQLFIFISCKNNEIAPQNTITLTYKGEIIEYKNVVIYKAYWIDKKGITASGLIEPFQQNNSIYSRVNIRFVEEPNGQYSVYEVDFGRGTIAAPNTFMVYKADLTKESDRATFKATVNQKNNELTGDFSGKVKVLVNSEKEISEGKYTLFLSTVKGD